MSLMNKRLHFIYSEQVVYFRIVLGRCCSYKIFEQVYQIDNKQQNSNRQENTKSMIFNAEKYFSRKEQIRSFKNALKNQIVKLALFVIVCVLVASLVSKSNAETSYTFYYAQNKIVNKHTRGVYPPLDGKSSNLYGCWTVAAKIGNERIDVLNFKNYVICFEQSGRLTISKKITDCKPSLNLMLFEWKTFSHNLFVSESKVIPVVEDEQISTKNSSDSTNTTDSSTPETITNSTISNVSNLVPDSTTYNPKNINSGNLQNQRLEYQDLKQKSVDAAIEPIKPIQCFNSSDTITTYVQAFTVWTVRESKIYLISEALINDKVDISIFVLQSKY